MRIDRVEATAFGPLAEAVLEFASGMTVIHGPNEAGKSTWHAALYAGLCGMRRGAGLRKEDRQFKERHRPWDGDAWSVAVRLTLDAGPAIEMQHDLDGRVDCRATDMTTGKDLSGSIMFDGSPDGSRFLGLNRQTFLSTVCVRQTETMAVLQDADSLQEQLQRAAATSGRDSTAETALRRLDVFRREQVGTERKNSTKPLRRAMDTEAASRDELATAEEAHEEYLELVRDRDRQLEEVREVEGRLRKTTQALVRLKVDDLRARVQRVRDLAAEFPDGPPQELGDDDDLADQVTQALTRFDTRPAEPVAPDGPTVEELAAQIAELPREPDGDLEPDEEVLEAEREWLRAQNRLEVHDENRPPTVDTSASAGPSAPQLRQAADDLEVTAPPVDETLPTSIQTLEVGRTASQPPSRALLAGGAAIVVIGLALLFALPPAVGAVLVAVGVGACGLAFLRRPTTPVDTGQLARLQAQLSIQQAAADQAEARRTAARQRCADWGVNPDPDALRQFARSVDEAHHAAERIATWEQQRALLTERVDECAQEVRNLLHGRGEPADDGDVEPLLEKYRASCRKRQKQQADADRRTMLASELHHRRETDAQREADRTARADAERQLREAASKVGITTEDLAHLPGELRAWQSVRSARRRAHQESAQNWVRLQEALDGRTLTDLEEELEACEARLDGAMPEPVDGDVDLLEKTVEELTADLQTARTAADELGGQVRERERTLPSVAEAEEEASRATAEVARLRRLQETLELTSSFLEAARDRVHRDIAPVLATAVTDRLPRITSNRYTEAIVDPASLEVRVRTRDGQLRTATLLSQGTSEQVYLLLRLAMAEHLVTTDESAPFILDDALVQTDSRRAAAVLDLLHEISTDRQVIVFSQEDDVLSWAKDNLQGDADQLVELAAP